MFATHPTLAAHFEPPVFSPGVPSRDLRNRLKFLEHAYRAGLIPEVEWKEIRRAVREQTMNGDDAINNDAVGDDDEAGDNYKLCTDEEHYSKKIDPFMYLATVSKTQSGDADDDVKTDNNAANKIINEKDKSKTKKNNRWLEYETISLVPISPQRKGSPADISIPFSMELWRKAKTLNRDRGVLACTFAHLRAMKTLVGECNENNTDLDGSRDENNGGYDFILEDNVRAFVGIGEESRAASNRIWDIIEASNEAPSECHMRYYGWLGSQPNLAWIYDNHIPRSAFNPSSLENTGPETGECTIFPLPVRAGDDSELGKDDSLVVQSYETSCQAPQFTTPGGTAVWGTFAYTVSSVAHRTLISLLQNDVGSVLWKGKRMRCYLAKPIDKILPRHVETDFGPQSVHLPDKVAFVRGPMLGSLLHPQWEEGFAASTELQYNLSCGKECVSSVTTGANGSDVWDQVWLTETERQVVKRRQKSGKWIRKDTLEKMEDHFKDPPSNGKFTNGSPRPKTCAMMPTSVSLAMFIATIAMVSFLAKHTLGVAAFTLNAPIHNAYRGSTAVGLAVSDIDVDGTGHRKRGKIGKVPIMSRTIPIQIEVPLQEKEMDENNNVKRLDVTVWEMDQPSDLIQEWWSIDETERNSRVGDPFGVVMWPGSILASKELMKQHYLSPTKSPLKNATVLVLGAGTGVEAQTAALLGAQKVIATDINSLTLKLLEYGAANDERIGDSVEGKYFDLFSDKPLPACDILIAADVLYNPELGKQVGLRLHEAITRSFEEGAPPTKVIITDSQKFHGTNFLEAVTELKELNALFEENDWEQLMWKTQMLENVCGSGVLIDEDQTYDVEVRMIHWGW